MIYVTGFYCIKPLCMYKCNFASLSYNTLTSSIQNILQFHRLQVSKYVSPVIFFFFFYNSVKYLIRTSENNDINTLENKFINCISSRPKHVLKLTKSTVQIVEHYTSFPTSHLLKLQSVILINSLLESYNIKYRHK